MGVTCFHCGERCDTIIEMEDKKFCCEGCKQVYLLLNENGLCTYYNFNQSPGIKAKGKFITSRFAYLDDAAILRRLVHFSSDKQINVTFSLPQVHCSSCIYLLEKLHRIEPGIIQSQVNFQRKEVFIIFDPGKISLRKVVELLAFIGYEPMISLEDSPTTTKSDKKSLYKIGIAGFCFANIMMLSLPEYFSLGTVEPALKQTFTWLCMLLSMPVLLYSARGFFTSAWKGLRQKTLNIDVPIALAILVSFLRSYYEIISSSGAGWLDSATGIVFFMLVGRWFQNKTYESFAFDRDYKSYFPLGANLVIDGVEKNVPVTQLQKGNHILIHNDEMIPADAVLIEGDANVDYSFVSGETLPVQKLKGELLYAGGKQYGSVIELEVVSDISQSYITQLWNNDIFKQKKNIERSFIHPWSRYFTGILFTVALVTAFFWYVSDPAKIWPAVTAVLIVACPCSLLLSATFTYGNMLRIFGKNKCYLKNAAVIESLAKIDTIIFDKTGTITQNNSSLVSYTGTPLTRKEQAAVYALTRQSVHPLSKMVTSSLRATNSDQIIKVDDFNEVAGKGIEGSINNVAVKIGSAKFTQGHGFEFDASTSSIVHVAFNRVHMGSFTVSTQYRDGICKVVLALQNKGYDLHLLSGDNDAEKKKLIKLFGKNSELCFSQSPQDKLDKVKELQLHGRRVLMMGDGLNDAGALKQSDVGIAVSDNTARFSPACDAIIDGNQIGIIHRLLAYAKSGKNIVQASFALSILYNITGLSFAVQGTMLPVVAAILMPVSSISIVLLVTLLSNIAAKKAGLV